MLPSKLFVELWNWITKIEGTDSKMKNGLPVWILIVVKSNIKCFPGFFLMLKARKREAEKKKPEAMGKAQKSNSKWKIR